LLEGSRDNEWYRECKVSGIEGCKDYGKQHGALSTGSLRTPLF